MGLESLSVLIVDDVNVVRNQIREMLLSIGVKTVFVASNGEEAKVWLETETIDFVLADWHMSPTNGLDLLKYLRQENPAGNRIAYVMISADSVKERVMASVQAGVDSYLLKPVTVVQLNQKLIQVATKRGLLPK